MHYKIHSRENVWLLINLAHFANWKVFSSLITFQLSWTGWLLCLFTRARRFYFTGSGLIEIFFVAWLSWHFNGSCSVVICPWIKHRITMIILDIDLWTPVNSAKMASDQVLRDGTVTLSAVKKPSAAWYLSSL